MEYFESDRGGYYAIKKGKKYQKVSPEKLRELLDKTMDFENDTAATTFTTKEQLNKIKHTLTDIKKILSKSKKGWKKGSKEEEEDIFYKNLRSDYDSLQPIFKQYPEDEFYKNLRSDYDSLQPVFKHEKVEPVVEPVAEPVKPVKVKPVKPANPLSKKEYAALQYKLHPKRRHTQIGKDYKYKYLQGLISEADGIYN